MKKAKLLAALLCSASMLAGSVIPTVPAMADAVKVVTLGADLTQDQKNTMLRYFNVDTSQVQIISITNADEREHLSAYVPLEQIGTRTVSCAYVKPTTSGGIKVRTANLNWVTCNMIATTLSTSGVTNCEVVAACPFEVSGTGALTGILMAYETASGEKLDEAKKEIATEEMVVTGNLANQVGQNDATTVINQAKMQVIADSVQDADEIQNIVINIANANGVSITNDQLSTIVNLLLEIAQQNYDYAEMQETLERVNDNVTGQAEASDAVEDSDSIVNDVDDSVLGEDVIQGSTEDPGLAEETGAAEIEEPAAAEIPEATGDGTETVAAEVSEGDGTGEITDVSQLSTDFLSEDAAAKFEKAKTFCKGEYEDDTASLQEAMGEDAYCDVTTLDPEDGKKLSLKVLKKYLGILGNGTGSYVSTGDEKYLTVELNMLDKYLEELFGIEVMDAGSEDADILGYNVSEEDKQTLYRDTMKFFEKLYGESYETYDELETEDEVSLGEAEAADGEDITEETIDETEDMGEAEY